MFTLLGILFLSVGICYATNCYELQQSQISSLNDRMAQMLNSFYTPLPQNPVPASDYSNPFNVIPYPYPMPQNVFYGPPPVFCAPPPMPTPAPATKPPIYYNSDPGEYTAISNWASYYDSYPHHYEYVHSSPYNPLVPPYQMSHSPYKIPPVHSYPASPQYRTPYSSSPPPFSYPTWEYPPYAPEYTTNTYAPPASISPYALPPPLSPLPASYPQLYHRHTEGSPPYFY